MDRLGADQAEQLRKCSTDRLRIKLSKAGGDEETIAAMGRDQLLDMFATLIVGDVNSWRTAKFTLVHIYDLPGEEGRAPRLLCELLTVVPRP